MNRSSSFLIAGCFCLAALIIILASGPVQAQTTNLITGNSAGAIKLGMSAAKARRVAKPLKVGSGQNVFEGDTQYRVTSGKKLVMTFIEYAKKIASIEVWDKSYRTAKGVSVGMSLRDLEKRYGKLKQIENLLGEGGGPEGESAIFANQPKGIAFIVAVRGKGKQAGIYPDADTTTTSKHNAGIYLKMIRVE